MGKGQEGQGLQESEMGDLRGLRYFLTPKIRKYPSQTGYHLDLPSRSSLSVSLLMEI